MAAPIRFLSGRQQQQKIGIEGSTDNQKVLEVVGQVGIGTTVFEPSVQLEVRGDASVSGVLTAGSLNITGDGGVPASLTVETLNATGVSTFGGAVDINAGLDVDGQSDLDEVVVAGVATFSNAVDINSTLDVDGDTQLDDLNVAGVSTFSSVVNATAAVNATDIIKGYKYTAVPYGSTVTLAVTVASKDSTHRYNGTGSGNAYVIDGIQAPFLTLTPGRTYRFTNDNTGSHPLKFYLEADRTTLYETNVNFQNTYTEITVTDETPIVLHYQCTNHGFMGNAVQTNANVVNTNYPATIRSTLDVSGVSTFTQLDVSTGGLDVDGLTNLDEVIVAGVSTFTGNIVAATAEFSGNVTIGGTLTSENKTNIDSVGLVTARTGVRVIAGGIDVTAGVSTFGGAVNFNDGVGVVGGLTADSLTISGITTGINAAGISSFVRINVDGQADLDEVVIAGVATFQGAVNFDVNSEINIGTGVTILGNNLHVTGIVSAAQFIGDGSGITNLPGISTLGSSNLTDVNVSGTTTTVQLRVSGIGTAENFFVSTGGFEVDGQSDLDELVVAGVSTFSANTFINADLSVTGDIGASGIITATGINLVAGSGLDVGAVGVLTALSVDVSTGGIDVDGQSNLDEVVIAGVTTFNALADVNNRLDVAGGANIDQLNVAGIASFTQLDVSTGGIDVDGQATLDELVVAGVSTFTGTVKIDGALDIGVAGVDVEGLTNLDELIVAGVSTFSSTINGNVTGNLTGTASNASGATGDFSIADKIVHTGDTNTALRFPAADTFTIETGGSERVRVTSAGNVNFLGSLVNVNATGVSSFVQLDVSTGGLDVDGQTDLDEVVVSGASTFTGAVKIDGALDIGTAGVDIDGQTDLDELQVAGVSTFSAKAVFNTAYPSIDADNEIQVGTAIQLGKAGVITATSFSGSGANLTGIAATDHVSTFDLVVAGISTFNDDVRILAGGLDVTGVSTFNNNVTVDGGGITFTSQGDKLVFSNAASNPASGGCIEIKTSASTTATIAGNANQLKIFSDDNSSQSIDLRAATYTVRDNDADFYALFNNGQVRLYHPDTSGGINDQKFETTGSGVIVTGVVTATSFSGSGANLTGIGTQGIDVQAQSLTVAGVSTFNDDVRITAGGINAAGVITATSFSGDGSALTGIAATDHVSTFDLVVAGVSTLTGNVSFGSSALFGDNDKMLFGDGQDMEMFFDGTRLKIEPKTDSTTSQFDFEVKDQIYINSIDNGIFLRSKNQSVIELYGGSGGGIYFKHNNTQYLKLEGGNWTTLNGTDFTFKGASADIVFDASDNAFEFADNAKAKFGTGGDLEIYHDATNSHITNATGDLKVTSNVLGVSGIITATGINVVAGRGLHAGNTGVITAVSFSGDGSNLSGVGTQGIDVQAQSLTVAGISTFHDSVTISDSLNALNVNVLTTNAALNIQRDGSTSGSLTPGLGEFKVQTSSSEDLALQVNSSGGTSGEIFLKSSSRKILKASHNGGIAISGIVTATAALLVAGSGLDAGNTGILTAVGAEFNGTSHIKLPAGRTDQRPGSPTAGDLRYNSDDGAFEGYTDSWGAIGGGIAEVDTDVSSTSVVGVGSFATASFRSAEVVAQISQVNVGAGVADYQVGKYLMIHDGTTVTVIEQAAVSTGDSMIGSFDGAINGSNAELRVTMVSSGIATVTTKISTITV